MELAKEDRLRLLNFFEAKGHEYLVLQVASIKELLQDYKLIILKMIEHYFPDMLGSHEPGMLANASDAMQGPGDHGPSIDYLLTRCAVQGYILLPFEPLHKKCNLDELEGLQEVVYAYRDHRRSKGVPVVEEKCECATDGRKPIPGCPACDGTGNVFILTEMSHEEIKLAELGVSGFSPPK